MSVFSITALDRLIESDRRSTSTESTPSTMEKQKLPSVKEKERRPLYVSYPFSSSTTSASPSPRPRSPSPSSFSPSPYVVNHKRRVPNGVNSKRTSQQNGFLVSDKTSVSSQPSESQQELVLTSGKEINNNSQDWPSANRTAGDAARQEGPVGKEPNSRSPQSSLTLQLQSTSSVNGDEDDSSNDLSTSRKKNSDEADSISRLASAGEEKAKGKRLGGGERKDMSLRNDDPRGKKKVDYRFDEGTSVQEGNASSSDKLSGASHSGARTPSGSGSEEWFDAPDAPLPEYSSDDDTRRNLFGDPGPSSRGDPDSNIFLQLKAEMQRRIAAEEAIEALEQQRDGMAQLLSSAGISVLHSNIRDIKIAEHDKMVGISDSEAQRLTVARYVAGAIATGAVRADAEDELQTVLAEKSKEIARLKDKLQYYELVNHEMSQRNQESIENARQSRRRRQRRQCLFVFGLGAAICVGVSVAVAYHYVPWEHVKGLAKGPSLMDGEKQNPKSLEERDMLGLWHFMQKSCAALRRLKPEEPLEPEAARHGDGKTAEDECRITPTWKF